MTIRDIRFIRRAFGYSQQDFAEYSGTSLKTYNVHESEPDQFRIIEVKRIADKLPKNARRSLAEWIVNLIFGGEFTLQ